jgi:hypothetical protein
MASSLKLQVEHSGTGRQHLTELATAKHATTSQDLESKVDGPIGHEMIPHGFQALNQARFLASGGAGQAGELLQQSGGALRWLRGRERVKGAAAAVPAQTALLPLRGVNLHKETCPAQKDVGSRAAAIWGGQPVQQACSVPGSTGRCPRAATAGWGSWRGMEGLSPALRYVHLRRRFKCVRGRLRLLQNGCPGTHMRRRRERRLGEARDGRSEPWWCLSGPNMSPSPGANM